MGDSLLVAVTALLLHISDPQPANRGWIFQRSKLIHRIEDIIATQDSLLAEKRVDDSIRATLPKDICMIVVATYPGTYCYYDTDGEHIDAATCEGLYERLIEKRKRKSP